MSISLIPQQNHHLGWMYPQARWNHHLWWNPPFSRQIFRLRTVKFPLLSHHFSWWNPNFPHEISWHQLSRWNSPCRSQECSAQPAGHRLTGGGSESTTGGHTGAGWYGGFHQWGVSRTVNVLWKIQNSPVEIFNTPNTVNGPNYVEIPDKKYMVSKVVFSIRGMGLIHRCPFPIGWLINRGVWNYPRTTTGKWW